jgi:protein TonB
VKPVPIGGKVQAGLLIKSVNPPYPDLAKRTRIQGAVHYQATIGKDGKIQNLQFLSGNPMLATPATMDAVSQWEYKPYLLNGEPTPVITEIIVNFVLN